MIAFNPDLIEVEITEVTPGDDGEVSVDWKMSVPNQGGIAYFRISPELRDFLKLCHSDRGVIGFEYDFEEGGLNFGVVVRDSQEELSEGITEL